MSVETFKAACCVKELSIYSAPAFYLPQSGFLIKGLCKRHLQLIRDKRTYLVRFLVWDVENTGDILHDSFRFQRSECDDLSDSVLSVMLRNIFDDLAAAFEAEVNIEIWKRYAFRVQESFEDEVVLDWIDICDRCCICDKGSRAASSSRTYRYVMCLGPVDVITNDQEVCREVHLYDDSKLVIEPFLQFWSHYGVSFLQSLVCKVCKILRIILELWRYCAFRKDRTGEVYLKMTAICDFT